MGIAPGSFGKPRLAAKMAEKLFRLRQLIPDLGQEGSPRLTIGEYHPVNAWAQFPDQVFPIGILKKGSRGENRDIDSHPVQFLRNQGRKTEIMEGALIEYSGPKLALFHYAGMAKLVVYSALFVALFLPWGSQLPLPVSFILFWAKVLVMVLLVTTVAATHARYRIDQAIRYFAIMLVVSLVTLAAASYGF